MIIGIVIAVVVLIGIIWMCCSSDSSSAPKPNPITENPVQPILTPVLPVVVTNVPVVNGNQIKPDINSQNGSSKPNSSEEDPENSWDSDSKGPQTNDSGNQSYKKAVLRNVTINVSSKAWEDFLYSNRGVYDELDQNFRAAADLKIAKKNRLDNENLASRNMSNEERI